MILESDQTVVSWELGARRHYKQSRQSGCGVVVVGVVVVVVVVTTPGWPQYLPAPPVLDIGHDGQDIARQQSHSSLTT